MRTSTHLIFFALVAVARAQSCKWSNGTEAANYVSCNPDSSHSNCCLRGEQCLSSGLCYGTLGLVYRGACTVWGNPECPEYCNTSMLRKVIRRVWLTSTVQHTWANLYPCAGGDGAAGPIGYWCGTGAFCDDNDGVTGSFHKALIPGNVLHVAGETTSPASVQTALVTTTVIATATVSNTSRPSQCPAGPGTCPTGVVAGSVGGPLLLIALVFGGLWGFERRRRRQMTKSVETASPRMVNSSLEGTTVRQSAKQGPWEKEAARVHELEQGAPEMPDRKTWFYELSGTPRQR